MEELRKGIGASRTPRALKGRLGGSWAPRRDRLPLDARDHPGGVAGRPGPTIDEGGGPASAKSASPSRRPEDFDPRPASALSAPRILARRGEHTGRPSVWPGKRSRSWTRLDYLDEKAATVRGARDDVLAAAGRSRRQASRSRWEQALGAGYERQGERRPVTARPTLRSAGRASGPTRPPERRRLRSRRAMARRSWSELLRRADEGAPRAGGAAGGHVRAPARLALEEPPGAHRASSRPRRSDPGNEEDWGAARWRR
jgi:hypothetical protein